MATTDKTQFVPPITINMDDVSFRPCPHCSAMTKEETFTVQVGDLPEGWDIDDFKKGKMVNGHCLQCIADGGTCCDLAAFNRWPENE